MGRGTLGRYSQSPVCDDRLAMAWGKRTTFGFNYPQRSPIGFFIPVPCAYAYLDSYRRHPTSIFRLHIRIADVITEHPPSGRLHDKNLKQSSTHFQAFIRFYFVLYS